MPRPSNTQDWYLPLFAGTELLRRSGALTTFPVGDLLGNLPPPSPGGRIKYRSPPELVGQRVQFGMSNALYERYVAAAGYALPNGWPYSGYSPAGVVADLPDQRAVLKLGGSGAVPFSEWVPFVSSGVVQDQNGNPVPGNITWTNTLECTGRVLGLPDAVYPAGTYDTMDAWLAACGGTMAPFPDGASNLATIRMGVSLSQVYSGNAGTRRTVTIDTLNNSSTDWTFFWETFMSTPYPTDEFDPRPTVQALLGGISTIFAAVWSGTPATLTADGLAQQAALRERNPNSPPGAVDTIGFPFRDPNTFTPAEYQSALTQGLFPPLMPGSINRPNVGPLGPSLRKVGYTVVDEYQATVGGPWLESARSRFEQDGATSANIVLPAGNYFLILSSKTFFPTGLCEQVYEP